MEKNIFPMKRIKQAVGVFLFLVCSLFLLSPYGSLNPLGYGVIWLFGYAGYYYLLPLSLFLSGFLAIKGKGIRFSWKQILALVLLFFGLGFLFGTLSFASFKGDLSDLFEKFQKALSHNEIAYDTCFGGGVPFTSLVGALGKESLALPLTFTILLLLCGVLLFLYEPLLSPLWHKLSLKIQRAKKIKASQKEIEEREALDAKENPSFDDIPFSFSEENAKNEEEKPLPSRSASNMSEPFSSPIIPEEVPTPFSPSFTPLEKKTSGLTAAVFNPANSLGGETISSSKQETQISKSEIEAPFKSEEAPIRNVLDVGDSFTNPLNPFETSKKDNPFESFRGEEPSKDVQKSFEEVPSPTEAFSSKAEEEPSQAHSIGNFLAENANVPLYEEKPHLEEAVFEAESPKILDKEKTQTLSEPTPEPIKQETIASSPSETPMTPVVEAGGEGAHWTAPPAKPTKEAILDNLGMPHKKPLKSYTFPSTDLLKDYPPSPEAEQEKLNCERRKIIIDEAFSSFHVGAYVEDFTIGPSVTRYNIKTEDGVSVGSLGRYIKDISVRLNGAAVRFEPIVRGRSTSGLEIPNEKTTTVSLKQMVEALPKKPGSGLYVPFGVNIDNAPIFADLADFPHLLTAGGTGSGKSVFLTGLIMSLIMRNRPEDLKLVLVDPKRVEMAKYHDLPHLLCPIVKEPSEAKVCLDKLIEEMENRYKAFETVGVKDIGEWNNDFVEESDYAKMPYIVVFIDEYADLSDCCKNIGDSVVRLAQKARAAGIHLVIATQRPSVSVITGTIKANILVRVALSMSSAIDSQTILGQGGAEELIGHGDMLVDCGQVSRMGFTRCQGCFCDRHEINNVCDFIRNQMEPEYNSMFLDLVDHEAVTQTAQDMILPLTKSEAVAKSQDAFYEEVKASVMQMEYTSISRIQRQFGVGFPRAGKMINRLQQDGIIAGAPDVAGSSKGLRVLVHADPNPQSNVTLAKDN